MLLFLLMTEYVAITIAIMSFNYILKNLLKTLIVFDE